MTQSFYLFRTLLDEDSNNYSEKELLKAAPYIVVLAEPGGGKTRLLQSFAQQLQTELISASRFRYSNSSVSRTALVLDAFDEISKIGTSSIFELLAKAQETGAEKVIISSRSSEWNSACTHQFEDFFNQRPTVVRLNAFNEHEQRQLFENYLLDEDFFQFRQEVSKFDLEILLPNPQFLQLFADAYIESERHFTNKRSIFEKAIERLAKEVNPKASQKPIISLENKIKLASEVFAKLLLSGSEGACLTDLNSSCIYPTLISLVDESSAVNCILETRLFKPGETVGQHQPVHKIVAEYCAATYLTNRLNSSSDNLNLFQCLAVIAPNSVVRDELRGVLGWMATLGNESTQRAIIELDAYAVLSNGDPSQLLPRSKQLLITQLKTLAKLNPLFRRSDRWRTFSTSGFFTQDVIGDIRPLLTGIDEHGHLRGLILELLAGSPSISMLTKELQELMLSPEQSYYIRDLASDRLLELTEYDHLTNTKTLIAESSADALHVAASILGFLGENKFDNTLLLSFFRACEPLYPKLNQLERIIGKRYFIKILIEKLNTSTVEWLLDELTVNLNCVCDKDNFSCNCRYGVSKIAGSLLDRYLESSNSYDAAKIWQWIKNLKFTENKNAQDSKAVKALQDNHKLRQDIIKLAFEHETISEKITELQGNHFSWHSHGHSGLKFQQQDFRFIADIAFSANNLSLWSCFIAFHHQPRNGEAYSSNELRRHMREQAKQNTVFKQEWIKRNKSIKSSNRQHWKYSSRWRRQDKKLAKQQAEERAANIKYINENRELIESGKHWNSLMTFAGLVLIEPDKIEIECGDTDLVKNALKNCFNFLEPDIPNLNKLADSQCQSQSLYLESVLYAACLETLRANGTLDGIKSSILAVVRTNMNMHYSAISNEEHQKFKAEIDSLLFPTLKEVENFIKEYIEPQLSIAYCKHTQVNWLKYEEAFKPLQKELPIEWLQRFRELSTYTLDSLFEMAARFGNRAELQTIISRRCEEYMSQWPDRTDNQEIEQNRTFWLLRAFYFLPDMPDAYWNWLSTNEDIILTFNEYSGSMSRSDYAYWPTLSAKKIELILTSFIGLWPKVKLPSSHGSSSPINEKAYRFLSEIIWTIGKDSADNAIKVLNHLTADSRFVDFEPSLRSIHANVVRENALKNFTAPSPQAIVSLLDKSETVTVEGLRALLLQEFKHYQAELNGSETTSKEVFYDSGKHIDEVPASLRIADRLKLRLEGKTIIVTPEHQLNNAKRCDITCSKMIGNKRRMLVIEVKGQWHSELYTAASSQLYERYSIHPDAEQQGIYLVLWFGKDEKVTGKKNTEFEDANDLKQSIEETIPNELRGLIDVFVLDLSRAD